VGDSLAQMVLGYNTTLSATMDIMIALTAAVRRGAPDVYLIGDMPFLSYQVSTEAALVNAGRFLTEAGCDCVKLELDSRYLDLVEKMASAGIPVMAHLGLRPQQIHQMGRLQAQGRTAETAVRLVRDVVDMVAAGACAILLECVPALVGRKISEQVDVPVISCGSGPYCDGQVLVLHDVLSLPGASSAKFVKSFAEVGSAIRTWVGRYIEEVHQGHFPQEKHSYNMKSSEQDKFDKELQDLTFNLPNK